MNAESKGNIDTIYQIVADTGREGGGSIRPTCQTIRLAFTISFPRSQNCPKFFLQTIILLFFKQPRSSYFCVPYIQNSTEFDDGNDVDEGNGHNERLVVWSESAHDPRYYAFMPWPSITYRGRYLYSTEISGTAPEVSE